MNKKYFWGLRALTWKVMGRKVGLPSFIGPPVFILGARNIEIGKNVRIWPGVRMEALEGAKVIIEDNVTIGQGCHITAAEDLIIRKDSVYTGHNVITNIHHSYREYTEYPGTRPTSINELYLGERLFVGFGAVILPGCSIPSGSTIGANSVLSKFKIDYPSVIAGVPAKVLVRLDQT